MSATSHDTAPEAAQGEFHSSVKPTGPQTTHGHQVGQQVSEEDSAPVFHAKILPAGTAPPEHTYTPNPSADDVPVPAAQNAGSKAKEAGTTTSAQDTIQGATSADVHTGLGHPGQGQSSKELRDESGGKGKGGLQGVGAGQAPSDAQEGGRKDFSTPVEGATQKSTGEEFTPGKSDMS